MYESHFHLRRNPFGQTPDPGLLFLASGHKDAVAGLTYAILGKKGFSVLTGDAGTGKTTLLRSVMRKMPPERVQFSLILNPVLSVLEFLQTAVGDFGIPEVPSNKAEALRLLHQFLLEVNASGRVAVLIIDEAHRLSMDLLEEVRLLANFETEHAKLLQVVLAGQDELSEILDRHEMRQLKQRIRIRLSIRPLIADEVGPYIRHRWRRLSKAELPFSEQSIRLVAEASNGIPRVINAICDNALLLAFAQGAAEVTTTDVAEAARDLCITVDLRQPDRPGLQEEAGFGADVPPPSWDENRWWNQPSGEPLVRSWWEFWRKESRS
ncbi:MAG: AAA family ATPase [Bryobacterales bacterium]|nr:AAA family ATPase [Bryobacterales bacterium]